MIRAGSGAVLITGTPGTGKSTVLAELRRRGHVAYDADEAGLIELNARRWRIESVRRRLTAPRTGPVFVAGCAADQADLHDDLDAIALLTAPLEVTTNRVVQWANPYGSTAAARAAIARDQAEVEPVLRATASRVLDSRRPVGELADDLEWLAGGPLWRPSTPGLLRLPSGRAVRGRSWRVPFGERDRPAYAIRLSSRAPEKTDGVTTGWIRWSDFRTPHDPAYATTVLREAWRRSAEERVEVVCRGGRGRTGTALACLLVLDGMSAESAIQRVRRDYRPGAIETPGQRRFVGRVADGSAERPGPAGQRRPRRRSPVAPRPYGSP